jgi:hypothetical protein
MSVHVTLPYDPTWKALEWAKKNCKSYVTNQTHQDGYNTYDQNKIDYFFSKETDAVLFAMKWR